MARSAMPERDGKDQGDDSPKQKAGSCWFARPCCLATSGANLYPPGVWFADTMTSFSGLRLFCFASLSSSCLLSLKPRPFVQSSFDMQAPRYPYVFLSFFPFFLFIYLEMSLFPSIFSSIAAFSLYGEYVVRSFLPNGVFLPCDHGIGWILDISLLLCDNSINQSIKRGLIIDSLDYDASVTQEEKREV